MKTVIEISGRKVGPGHPCYIVAELSANHGHSFERAVELVHAAGRAGADAVKLQTYTADTITIDSGRPEFVIGANSLWSGRKLHDLYQEAHTPWEWQPRLKEVAESLGMHCFSTPFDDSAVDFLEGMGVPAHKVASFELVDSRLLRKVAACGKPVIMSTGMADPGEISDAVRALRSAGCRELALLKCTSAYPAPPEEMNLRTIAHLSETYGVPCGLSDHSIGIAVPVAAVVLGATLIEKHLTLRRSDGGPDAGFSLEPGEFAEMVRSVRTAEHAVGTVCYEPGAAEIGSRRFRRSLYVVRQVREGEPFTCDNIRSIRPADGLAPSMMDLVLGRRASRSIEAGTPLSFCMCGAPL